jgi:crotonobetainyl-CoA:carnitine CoA-transferase CaiB-like acyl-CoA transferase
MHTESVLRELGYDQETIEGLEQDGVVCRVAKG